MAIKVGDFIRNNELHRVDRVEHITENCYYNSIQYIGDLYNSEKWTPLPDEWCWFWDVCMEVPILQQFKGYSTNPQLTPTERYVPKHNPIDSWGFDYCEPFIGPLPTIIRKEKK